MLTFQEDHTGFDPAHEAKLHAVRRCLEHLTIIVGHEFDRASANAGAIRARLHRLDVFLVVAHRRDILEMQKSKRRRCDDKQTCRVAMLSCRPKAGVFQPSTTVRKVLRIREHAGMISTSVCMYKRLEDVKCG